MYQFSTLTLGGLHLRYVPFLTRSSPRWNWGSPRGWFSSWCSQRWEGFCVWWSNRQFHWCFIFPTFGGSKGCWVIKYGPWLACYSTEWNHAKTYDLGVFCDYELVWLTQLSFMASYGHRSMKPTVVFGTACGPQHEVWNHFENQIISLELSFELFYPNYVTPWGHGHSSLRRSSQILSEGGSGKTSLRVVNLFENIRTRKDKTVCAHLISCAYCSKCSKSIQTLEIQLLVLNSTIHGLGAGAHRSKPLKYIRWNMDRL